MEEKPAQNYTVPSEGGLSGVIITHNAERYLEKVLIALRQICDEVVVVDCGSQDATERIARRMGARFFLKAWQGYGAQKNWGIQQARGGYILSIDADEVPDETLLQSIRAARQAGLKGVYRINRLPFWCGRPVRHSGWYPDRKVRLFPKGQACWSQDPVHERLLYPPHVPVQDLEGHLFHFTYHSIQEHEERTQNYARLAAGKLSTQNTWRLRWGMWVKPPLKFITHWLVRGGFLDGTAGWHIARISALGVWWRYQEAWTLKTQKSAL
ncbi:MAG: glycosyltransferase family 2 protein [Flavobacteriales bacterium]|nr:glycosyltransferase family 2 protein [Flavobacteriales bacterium]MCX7648947.1 glycosyltransferase family 2 protein [Flavobacteriales bacterium]MDW8432586.1 glycosyltransferase family 2 protein [Flavobacteriales bacterium]